MTQEKSQLNNNMDSTKDEVLPPEESDSQSKPAFAQINEPTNENAIKHQEDLQSKVIEIFDGEILR